MKKVEVRKDLAAFISESTYFQGLPVAACVRLAGVSRIWELGKRDVLFHEGTKGSSVFLMLSGCLQLHKTAPDGTDRVIRIIRSGDVFAEAILFEQDRYPVTATALASSRVLAMGRQRIIELLDNRRFRDDFIKMLLNRQRYLAERVRYLTSFDVESRFFRFLKENYGQSESIMLDLPKKDIAAAIGATPETFSRLVQRLQSSGDLLMSGKQLRITEDAWSRADVS